MVSNHFLSFYLPLRFLKFRKRHQAGRFGPRLDVFMSQSNWGEAPNLFHIRFKLWQQNANNNMMGSIGSKPVQMIPI